MNEEWKKPSEVFSGKALAILGGRTPRENFEYWNARWAQGAGIGEPERLEAERTPYAKWGPRYAGHWPPGWNYGQPVPEYTPPAPVERDPTRELEMHLTRVGVPIRLAEVLQHGLEQREAVQRVAGWYAGAKSLMLLHGAPAGGKSVAAASAFMHTKKPSWVDGQPEWDSSGAFIDAADVASNLFREETREMLAWLENCQTVVIDELGAETLSDPWLGTLETLVNKRFGSKRRTLLCTNISAKRESLEKPSPFERRYGARIARRIRESGEVFAVEAA